MPDFLDRYGAQLQLARRRRRRRRAARVSLLVPAAAAVAVFAIPRTPDTERPVPPATTRTPVPTPETVIDPADHLAVLRRPQDERDRELGRAVLEHPSSPVPTATLGDVRALDDDHVLVPDSSGSEPVLCIVSIEGGYGCGPVQGLLEGGVSISSGGRKSTILLGVVPDYVARVRFALTREAVDVHDNFYELHVARTGRIPLDAIQWLDAAGMDVGPT